jgi:hypothetical protein
MVGVAGGGSDMAGTAGVRLGRNGPQVTGIAIEMVPDDILEFVRDPAMLPELALMGASSIAPRARATCTTKSATPGTTST